MQTRRVVFLALPLLLVPLVYSTSSASDACAQQPSQGGGPKYLNCSEPDEEGWVMCCYFESGQTESDECDVCRETSPGNWDCNPPDDWGDE